MPEIPIHAEHVDELSQKLQGLRLSDDEAAVLSGIFAVAADALSPSGAGVGTTSLVSEGATGSTPTVRVEGGAPSVSDQFRQQFRQAFTADPPPSTDQAVPTMIVPLLPPRPKVGGS